MKPRQSLLDSYRNVEYVLYNSNKLSDLYNKHPFTLIGNTATHMFLKIFFYYNLSTVKAYLFIENIHVKLNVLGQGIILIFLF